MQYDGEIEEAITRRQKTTKLYQRRQEAEINEHFFGTIKRQCYNHTNLTGLSKWRTQPNYAGV
jgi:hypothetical protein